MLYPPRLNQLVERVQRGLSSEKATCFLAAEWG